MDFQLGHQGWGLAVSFVWFVTYWALIITRAVTDAASFTEVAWQHPLLWMLVIGVSVYGAIYAYFYWNTRGAIRTDERDVEIRRRSDAAGAGLTALGAIAALVMLALDVDAFWVAHAILVASFLGVLASTGQTVTAYMNGLDR